MMITGFKCHIICVTAEHKVCTIEYTVGVYCSPDYQKELIDIKTCTQVKDALHVTMTHENLSFCVMGIG